MKAMQTWIIKNLVVYNNCNLAFFIKWHKYVASTQIMKTAYRLPFGSYETVCWLTKQKITKIKLKLIKIP
jgi:hypothetical protein